MPYGGTGTFTPPGADFPAVTLTTVSSTHFNNVINDIATGLSNAVTRDGQSAWSANLPSGGFKITGMGAGTLSGDSTRVADVQTGVFNWVAAGGTVDVITATYNPAITALVDGQTCTFRALGANATTTPTFSPSGLTARIITRNGGSALQLGDIPGNLAEVLLKYNLANTRWELMNPAVPLATSLFTTGDAKVTIKTVADTGWVLFNDGTMGNAASGGTTRANADTVALFTLLYNNTTNADCAVSGGRGANAATDYAANKTIALPKALGRVLATFGTGSGLTARTMGSSLGVETYALSQAETPVKAHAHAITDPGHPHTGTIAARSTTSGVGNTVLSFDASGGGTGLSNTSAAADLAPAGGIAVVNGVTNISLGNGADATASAHQNMQPTLFLNVMLKL